MARNARLLYKSAQAPRLVYIQRMTFRAGHAVRAHAHPVGEMLVLLGGEMSARVGEREVSASGGDVLLYPPGVAHSERVSRAGSAEFYCAGLEGLSADWPPVVRDLRGRARLLAGWMLEDARGAAGPSREAADALLGALLAELGIAAAGRPDELVSSVREHLRRNLARAVTVGELARRAHMSRAHFIRTYKRLAGRTPMQELRALRVEAARDLVVGTGLPLKAIAPQTGFCDEYHLSRVFRQVLGATPGHFRWRCGAR